MPRTSVPHPHTSHPTLHTPHTPSPYTPHTHNPTPEVEDPVAVNLVASALRVTFFGQKGAPTAAAPSLPLPALVLFTRLNSPVLRFLLLRLLLPAAASAAAALKAL